MLWFVQVEVLEV